MNPFYISKGCLIRGLSLIPRVSQSYTRVVWFILPLCVLALVPAPLRLPQDDPTCNAVVSSQGSTTETGLLATRVIHAFMVYGSGQGMPACSKGRVRLLKLPPSSDGLRVRFKALLRVLIFWVDLSVEGSKYFGVVHLKGL